MGQGFLTEVCEKAKRLITIVYPPCEGFIKLVHYGIIMIPSWGPRLILQFRQDVNLWDIVSVF